MENTPDFDQLLEEQLSLNKDDDQSQQELDVDKEVEEEKTDENIETDPLSQNEDIKDEEGSDSDKNVLLNYFEFLKDQELIVTDDDYVFKGTEEELNDLKIKTVNYYKDKALEELKEALPDKFKEVLIYGLNGGKDPLELYQNRDSFDYDLNNENHQREVVRLHLSKTTRFSEEKIEKTITQWEKSGELEAEAYDALEELKELKKEETEAAMREAQLNQQEKERKAKELRDNISETIKDSEYISKERKSKIQAFMFNPIKKGTEVLTDYERNLRNIAKNPKHLVQLADIIFDYDNEKGINLERFKKIGESSANKSLKEKLENKMNNLKNPGSTKAREQQNYVNWSDFLK